MEYVEIEFCFSDMIKDLPELGSFKVTNKNQMTRWVKDRELHRTDGPALIYKNGDEVWYKNGEIHRDHGPAIVRSTGSKVWYKNGKLHRTDGPAKILVNRNKNRKIKLRRLIAKKAWHLFGKEYSKEEWFEQLTPEQLAIALANQENF